MAGFYKAAGQPIPKECISPEIHDVENDYLSAFWELSTCRVRDGGPIPIDSIIRYHSLVGFDDLSMFKEVMISLDAAYLLAKSGEVGTFKKGMLKGKDNGSLGTRA